VNSSQKGDLRFYCLGAFFGILAGWMDVKVGDLLFTALFVLAPSLLLGALQPEKPWRWALIISIFVPIVQGAAYLVAAQKPSRAQIYGSFLTFLPGAAGAYGGAVFRGVVDNLLRSKDR